MALVVVLWGAMLLSVMAAGFAFSMRTESIVSGNYLQRAQAEALAGAGIRRGILALLEPASHEEWQFDGSVQERRFARGVMRIAISSENGKIDLNVAPDALIQGLFDSVADGKTDLNADEARRLAAAVIAWRDAGGRPGHAGGGAGESIDPRRHGGARNDAFLAIGDLNRVPGMQPPIFAAVADSVTVYSQSPKVDPATASEGALRAIPGLDRALVEQFISAREAYRDGNGAAGSSASRWVPIALLGPGAKHLSRARSTVYSVLAEGVMPSGVRASRRAVIRLTGNKQRPYAILAWTDPTAWTQAEEPDCCELAGRARAGDPTGDKGRETASSKP